MTTPSHQNPWLQLAYDFVYHTGQSIFLTGKAGTGKTTFLRSLKADCPKQMVVLAPTGVAAINAGGTTIHSFFQLPFTPFIPATHAGQAEATNETNLLSRIRFNRERRELICSLELLVIDEISMVRADVMDAIDTVLRHVRKSRDPFGGVQLLLIGDLYQLPPVVPDSEWQLLREFYPGIFFFDSRAIRQSPPTLVELQTIYRQSDSNFVDLLNQVRNNQLDEAGLRLLNGRVISDFRPPDEAGYITLTTHNAKADAINERKLANIAETAFSYRAKVEGDFQSRNFPAEEVLVLKQGAQVMFLKNDIAGKRFFNGKIGVVEKLEEEHIWVRCSDSNLPIEVKPETWRNVQYTLNRTAQQVEENEIGTFTQYPLRLAWAVTIHKSQGLTFTHAVIDAAAAFSAGQIYVALSRCTSFEGMVLQQPVPRSAVMADGRIRDFSSQQLSQPELEQFLQQSRIRFQQQLLLGLTNGKRMYEAALNLAALLDAYPQSFGGNAAAWQNEMLGLAKGIKDTGKKFADQLLHHFGQSPIIPDADPWVQQRIQLAAPWFLNCLNKQFVPLLTAHPIVTDSEEQAADFEKLLAEVYVAAKGMAQGFDACRYGFDATAILRAKSKINIAEITGMAYAGSTKRKELPTSEHADLYLQLKACRDEICRREGKPIYLVLGTRALTQMAISLPQTPDELLQVSGFGPQKLKQYGQQFLDIIVSYCQAHQLSSALHLLQPKRKRKTESGNDEKPFVGKPDTKRISLELLQAGKSIVEIAAARNLQLSIIEGHLATYAIQGIIPRELLIHEPLFEKIQQVFLELQTNSLGAVKQVLGDEASFGQIKLVHDWMIHEGIAWRSADMVDNAGH